MGYRKRNERNGRAALHFWEGNRTDYPKYYRRAKKRLRRVQKKFSRSKKFSNNCEKIRVMLSRVYEKVTNRRKDFLHKLSSRLVNENDAIEDLDLQAMSKHKRGGRFSFGKSISDNGWGMFTRMLEYKLNCQRRNKHQKRRCKNSLYLTTAGTAESKACMRGIRRNQRRNLVDQNIPLPLLKSFYDLYCIREFIS